MYSTPKSNRRDGTYMGEAVPAGTYHYKITVENYDGESNPLKEHCRYCLKVKIEAR